MEDLQSQKLSDKLFELLVEYQCEIKSASGWFTLYADQIQNINDEWFVCYYVKDKEHKTLYKGEDLHYAMTLLQEG